jgi:predicted enzyme related to lactoylglutathione lyase
MSTPYLPGKFIWFEHASGDIAKARAFYEPLFGWHVETMTMADKPYHMLMNGSGGIGGLTTAKPGAPATWISYISVPDVDKSCQAALAAGAKGTLPPTDFPPVGRGAAIVDPTGAAVSLWKSHQGDRPDLEQTPVSDWYWNELWTHDAKKALAFYETAFGYTHEVMQTGDAQPYLLLHASGKARGGIFEAPDKKTPPMWLPYVGVADCDATAAKATQLGGKVFMPPTDVAGVGRFAAMFDPQGAPIAFIKGAPQPG